MSKSPNEPVIAFRDRSTIIDCFDANEPLCFYFPMLPGKIRDDITIEMLSAFPKSHMLMEKPSHNSH